MNKPYDTPAADTPRASEPAAVYGNTAPAASVLGASPRLAANRVEKAANRTVQNRMTYFVYCINAFAAYHGLTSKQAFAYLHRFKGLDFLDECYEAETMAVRRTRIAGEGEPTLTAYHFDERMLLNAALNVKVFDAPCLANSHLPMNDRLYTSQAPS